MPPFSNPKKKAEFPDAVTLLSLENWAETNDYKILAISGDGDWAAFGEQSNRIDVVSDIGKGLDILNGQLSEARVIAGKVLDLIDTGSDALLRSRFKAELESALDNLAIDSEAESYHHIEGEQVELSLREWSLLHVPSFELLASDAANEVIVVAVDALIDVDATADFYISAYDSGDNDYTSIGSTTASVKKQLEVKVLVTILASDDTFEIGVVGLHKAPSFINFGEVEPDFSNDYYSPLGEWDELEPDDDVQAVKDA